MSNPGDVDATPITGTRQLAEHIAEGCKPPAAFRIGTEHEKFGFFVADRRPPPYAPDGIRALLDAMASPNWGAILDDERPIGLKGAGENAGASVSLEPAGQLELSGAPLSNLHETLAEMDRHFAAMRVAAAPLGIAFAPLGFHPTMTRADMPWMPKGRYAIMRRYMPLVGTLGLDMMQRTCTVQVNLDYSAEADMRRKLQVALALQPLATALFANSPFTEGRPNGFQSYRAHIWTDVDRDRSGIPPVMFEENFGFERYVEWLLDVPMYFVYRNDEYIDVAGQSFRAFMQGRLPGLPGEVATVGDFADHMTTVFTDVRLKRFLEMRGADAGSPAMMAAQSALWVGLLYDDAALAAASALVRRHDWTEFAALRPLVPRQGLATAWQGGVLRDLARDVVSIAADGLRARGFGEEMLLEPLKAIAAGGPTQADLWLERYENVWNGDASMALVEAAV